MITSVLTISALVVGGRLGWMFHQQLDHYWLLYKMRKSRHTVIRIVKEYRA